jgi:hypothetical protein
MTDSFHFDLLTGSRVIFCSNKKALNRTSSTESLPVFRFSKYICSTIPSSAVALSNYIGRVLAYVYTDETEFNGAHRKNTPIKSAAIRSICADNHSGGTAPESLPTQLEFPIMKLDSPGFDEINN